MSQELIYDSKKNGDNFPAFEKNKEKKERKPRKMDDKSSKTKE